MTDVKLGILLWSQGATWPEMLDAARRIDRLGYAHLWTWDHLYAPTGDPYQPVFEGATLLAALAAITEHVELGSSSVRTRSATRAWWPRLPRRSIT